MTIGFQSIALQCSCCSIRTSFKQNDQLSGSIVRINHHSQAMSDNILWCPRSAIFVGKISHWPSKVNYRLLVSLLNVSPKCLKSSPKTSVCDCERSSLIIMCSIITIQSISVLWDLIIKQKIFARVPKTPKSFATFLSSLHRNRTTFFVFLILYYETSMAGKSRKEPISTGY